MKKTMLTYKTLDRFESEYNTENYTKAEIEAVEHAAYVANMNTCSHPEWAEADIFNDFMRVLSIHKITTTPKAIKEDLTMERYDYLQAVTEDVKQYILDEVDAAQYADRGALEEALNDDLWAVDGVTGNASGSYFFNTWEAEEALSHNWDLLAEALEEFGGGTDILKDGAEAMDVTIRCYLLGQAICAALDDLEEELTFAEGDSEEE